MTYKSFTTVDELFDLLVERFRIQPPANMTPSEHDDWAKHKQHIIQTRSIPLPRICVTCLFAFFIFFQSAQYLQVNGYG